LIIGRDEKRYAGERALNHVFLSSFSAAAP